MVGSSRRVCKVLCCSCCTVGIVAAVAAVCVPPLDPCAAVVAAAVGAAAGDVVNSATGSRLQRWELWAGADKRRGCWGWEVEEGQEHFGWDVSPGWTVALRSG